MEDRSLKGESPSGSPHKDPRENPPGLSKPHADPYCKNKERAKETNLPLAQTTDNEDEESLPVYVRHCKPQERETDGLENLEPRPLEPVQKQCVARFDSKLQKEPHPDTEPQPTGSPHPGQQAANVPDLGQQPPGEPDSGQQAVNVPDPGQKPTEASDNGQQPATAPDPAHSASWDRCVSFYKRINSFNFQFPFHILLLAWPLSTLAMGVRNLEVCRMNILPYWMLAVGLLGLATIIYRLNIIYIEERFRYVTTANSGLGYESPSPLFGYFLPFNCICSLNVLLASLPERDTIASRSSIRSIAG